MWNLYTPVQWVAFKSRLYSMDYILGSVVGYRSDYMLITNASYLHGNAKLDEYIILHRNIRMVVATALSREELVAKLEVPNVESN